MPEAGASEATETSECQGDLLAEIAHSLHEMCQPLTVLQCRLEIDLMESDLGPRVKGTAADCLLECERLNVRVHAMRVLVQRGLSAERRGQA